MRHCDWCGEIIHIDEVPMTFGYLHDYCVDSALEGGAVNEEDLFDE